MWSLLRISPFFALFLPLWAHAGELVIRNTSPSAVTCHVDGYTSATGWAETWDIKVEPGENVRIEPNYKRPSQIIDWAECGGLKTRAMQISPQGADGLVLFTGKQSRVLNVALYPDIPSRPNGNFGNLLDHVINVFQAANPDVLLNAVIADENKLYSFDALPDLLGPKGYDVVEVDTLYLGFLASNDLITPAKITGDQPWTVGLAGATYKGVLYGVPSWLCLDFVFSFSPTLKSVRSLDELLRFVGRSPKTRPALIADYDGSWRLPAIYIDAYVGIYGYEKLSQALTMPPDAAVIDSLKKLARTCEFESENHCVDGSNHAQPDGGIERVFANGNASAEIGFSEQSFYIASNQTVSGNLTMVPVPWGERPNPLLYVDAFVTSKATCAAGDCQNDSAALTSLMTSATMKTYIAFSQDLSVDASPRHLLVATQPFWDQDVVKNDLVYQQAITVVRAGKPFPNDFTKQTASEMDIKICNALKAGMTRYQCK